VRVVRIGCVAAIALVLTACSGGERPAPVASSSGVPAKPTASPSPTSTAAALARVPVREVPDCAHVACAAVAVAEPRSGLTLALVRGPDTADQLRQTAYLLSVDGTGRRLGALRLLRGDFFFDSLPELTCDALAHCFVAASSGAHTGVMNVVAVDEVGRLTDLSQAGTLTVDTVDLAPKDLDEDGVAEVLGRINDFTPNYAGGSDYWMVWTWNGTRYAPTGCRKIQPGEDEPGGPVTLSGCPH
jgi:hypothetical protein